jgi:putative nucleotidyltransferase with HDIG domain
VAAAEKILALAGALNAHDRLTRGHGERVRVLTDLIADELDLPTHDRDRLRWSALLHDIGKLAVHPDILNKPGKLNDDEWEVIKKHPLEGAKLTAPLAGWLGQWANTIAEHHEKFDGTGYPYGLKGDQISLGGRIVAVADCYDTMTNVRTYKSSMSPKAARAELAACAGTHFDPKVVRAFLDVSIGRLRPVAGPLAWLGSVPFVSGDVAPGTASEGDAFHRCRFTGARVGICRDRDAAHRRRAIGLGCRDSFDRLLDNVDGRRRWLRRRWLGRWRRRRWRPGWYDHAPCGTSDRTVGTDVGVGGGRERPGRCVVVGVGRWRHSHHVVHGDSLCERSGPGSRCVLIVGYLTGR